MRQVLENEDELKEANWGYAKFSYKDIRGKNKQDCAL